MGNRIKGDWTWYVAVVMGLILIFGLMLVFFLLSGEADLGNSLLQFAGIAV